jgi:hypothetical protein
MVIRDPASMRLVLAMTKPTIIELYPAELDREGLVEVGKRVVASSCGKWSRIDVYPILERADSVAPRTDKQHQAIAQINAMCQAEANALEDLRKLQQEIAREKR